MSVAPKDTFAAQADMPSMFQLVIAFCRSGSNVLMANAAFRRRTSVSVKMSSLAGPCSRSTSSLRLVEWGMPFNFAVLAIHDLKALFLGQCFAALYRLTYPR